MPNGKIVSHEFKKSKTPAEALKRFQKLGIGLKGTVKQAKKEILETALELVK